MKSFFAVITLAAAAALLPMTAPAGEYTGPGLAADMVIRNPVLGGGRFAGRYYFDRGGYRLDIKGRAKYRSLIFNSFHQYFITIAGNSRMNVEEDSSGALLAQFGDFPCAGFHEAVGVGNDGKKGRELQVWRCRKPKQELLDGGYGWDYRVTVWYDPELKHFVRKEGNDGTTIELKKIVRGRQAPSLFSVPSGTSAADAAARIAEIEKVE